MTMQALANRDDQAALSRAGAVSAPAPEVRGAAFADYPFLTPDEFAEVCHDFDRLYRQATLGPLRRRWRVSVRTALGGVFSGGAVTSSASAFSSSWTEYSTYLQITRPLDEDPAVRQADDELAGALDRFSIVGGHGRPHQAGRNDEDQAMVEAEEADEAALHPAFAPSTGSVTYEVHWHPTYRAPCLWFALKGLPNDEPAFSIDTVFRRLVPASFQDSLRAMGNVGGISADCSLTTTGLGQYHPVTGVPSFFVHPCLLGEAIADFNCSKKNYLMIWLGLVGGCVSLWVPKEMALPSASAA